MKKIVFKVGLACFLAFASTNTFAMENNKEVTIASKSETKTVTFKVYGNCGMCKKTIEESLKDVKGVDKANWNVDSKMMEVTFNEDKISLDEIKKIIASAGYDTEEFRASNEVYNNLSGCCQYERPEKEPKMKHSHKEQGH